MDGDGDLKDSDPNDFPRRSSRRFTTLEGWREVRGGLYLAVGSAFSTIIPNPAYDPEWHIQDDEPLQPTFAEPYQNPANSFALNRSTGHGQSELWPHGRFHSITTEAPTNPLDLGKRQQSLFAEGGSTESEKTKTPPVPERPFHSFTTSQKWLVISTIGVAGLFSGLSSNIYFPSLDAIATDLNVSLSAVSLTITSYLIIQGISPLIWGPLSDTIGRRPIYIYSFSVYIAANVVLSLSPNFPLLLVFRGLQSAGSASTVSIGNGVIQDIATPIERGAFISFYQAIRNFSIAVGPVLGGLLAQFFGFRSIFIFLVIISSLVLIVIILVLPETLRSIAGDGTWSLSGIYQPLIRRYRKEHKQAGEPQPIAPRPIVTVRTFLEPLKLLKEKDIIVSLIFGGTVYTVWSMVVASTTGLFKDLFQLDELKLGLIFLPNGFGTIVGSAIAGKLMTREFINYEREYLVKNPHSPLPSKNKKDLPADFPIEHARLRHTPWITALFTISTAIYGFTVLPAAQLPLVSRPGWMAVPLTLQFIIAATSNAVFAINTALVSDLCPGKGAGATAINNLVRCSLGALGVGFVDAMIGSFGSAASFLGLGLLTAAMGVLLAMEWSWGMHWRNQREQAKTIKRKESVVQ